MQKQRSKKKHIVTIGGGTGTFTVLSGLKAYKKETKLSALVTVTDSGGSTGRLRDEFGFLPVGDFRMALVALADDHQKSNILRELFLYRFDKGLGLSGHNVGNLFLVALTDILGSEEAAIAFVAKMLQIRGSVIPIANGTLTLVARYENGSVVHGEALIDQPDPSHDGTQRITDLWIEPHAEISFHAKETIEQADLIVLGPGDLYTSTLACLVVPGVCEALKESSAKIVYVVNLMTKYGQTYNFSARDHVHELEHRFDRAIDAVFMNNVKIPRDIVEKYKAENDYVVQDDFGGRKNVFRADVLAQDEVIQLGGDVLKRSLVRHDPHKLAKVLLSFAQSQT